MGRREVGFVAVKLGCDEADQNSHSLNANFNLQIRSNANSNETLLSRLTPIIPVIIQKHKCCITLGDHFLAESMAEHKIRLSQR